MKWLLSSLLFNLNRKKNKNNLPSSNLRWRRFLWINLGFYSFIVCSHTHSPISTFNELEIHKTTSLVHTSHHKLRYFSFMAITVFVFLFFYFFIKTLISIVTDCRYMITMFPCFACNYAKSHRYVYHIHLARR